MWTLISTTLAYLGFAALAYAMPRHFAQLAGGGKPGRAVRLGARAAGVALLAVSLVPVLLTRGAAIGITVWLGILTIAAFLLAMVMVLLDYGHARGLAWVPPLTGALLALWLAVPA